VIFYRIYCSSKTGGINDVWSRAEKLYQEKVATLPPDMQRREVNGV